MHKTKKFNTTGLCIPQYHYMADVRDKVNRIIKEYVDQDEYFTINRARQHPELALVSCLCKIMDEKELPWDKSGIHVAVKELLKTNIILCLFVPRMH